MTWSDAARKAAIAARQAHAKGRTQHNAAVKQAAQRIRRPQTGVPLEPAQINRWVQQMKENDEAYRQAQKRVVGTIGRESMVMTKKDTPEQAAARVAAAGRRAKARRGAGGKW